MHGVEMSSLIEIRALEKRMREAENDIAECITAYYTRMGLVEAAKKSRPKLDKRTLKIVDN